MDTAIPSPEPSRDKLNWINFLFINTAHVVSVALVVYMFTAGVSWDASMDTPGLSWWSVILGLTWGLFSSISITGGYHRLFSHCAYKAAWPLRLFYLAFGAVAAQNSAINWSIDHRRHHAKVDTDEDPYNINRGFWWAHIVWVFFLKPNSNSLQDAKDLAADRLTLFQHRYYVAIAIVLGAVVPFFLGLLWGDPIGAMLMCGALRLVLQYHATFSINSVTHKLGRRPYSLENSARDSFVAAVITMGEGYHNFHHRFQADYRNGIRWYHYDPTKWFVWTLSKIGVTSDLRVTAQARIDKAMAAVRTQREAAKAALTETAQAIAEKSAQAKLVLSEKGAQARQAIADTQACAQALANDVIEKGEEALGPNPRTTPN